MTKENDWAVMVINKNQDVTFANSNVAARFKATSYQNFGGIHVKYLTLYVEDWDNQPEFIQQFAGVVRKCELIKI